MSAEGRAVSVDVSILIVTYRCAEEVRECLRSIDDGTSSAVSHEVIVLDNASRDGTVEMIAAEFPWVRLLALDENLGFARGVNRAGEEARGEFVLLLNPDTVVHPGTIERLVEFARHHPEHGIYGGRTVRPDGTLDPISCRGKPTLWSTFCFATMLSAAFPRSALFNPELLGRWQRDSVREVDVVTGCLLLTPRPLWERLGGLDTRFFMYGEDVDLSLRAAEAGFRPVITPDAVVTHELGASSETRADKMALVFRARVTVIRMHWPRWQRPLGVGLLWLGVGLRALLARVGRLGSPAGAGRAMWRGVWRERRSWLQGYPASGPGRATP